MDGAFSRSVALMALGSTGYKKAKMEIQCQQDDRCCTYHCKFICLKTKFDIFPDIFSHVPLPPNILLCGSSDQRQHTGYLPEDFRAPRERGKHGDSHDQGDNHTA